MLKLKEEGACIKLKTSLFRKKAFLFVGVKIAVRARAGKVESFSIRQNVA